MNAEMNKRTPLLHRPWITGKLYDDYTRPSILHCDAYVVSHGALNYLIIDWREGGKTNVALDGWLIEPGGLTETWDIGRLWNVGVPQYWTQDNHVIMRAIHKRVLAQASEALKVGNGRWARVVTQAHYVKVRETDCEIADNKYVERKPKGEPPTLRDVLSKPGVIGKPRGRPRKPRRILPDWL